MKTISRQLAHYRAKIIAGRCGSCGQKPLVTKAHCEKCAQKNRERALAALHRSMAEPEAVLASQNLSN